jgi:acyl-CoA thioester hydrolase
LKKINWPVKTELPIQWGDMDAFSHVNNVIYIRWFETARIELFIELWGGNGINLQEILDGDGVGPILANFNINYHLPLLYPDIVHINTRISKVGNSSFGVSHQLFSKNNRNKIIASADSVVVMYNYQKGEKFLLKDDQIKKLKGFM